MQTQNQNTKHIIKAIRPTTAEIISISITSFIALLLFAGMRYFQDIDSNSYKIVVSDIESYIRQNILATLDQFLGIGMLTLAFWMLIGTLVYSLVWVTASTYSAYKNDLPITKGLVLPTGHKHSSFANEAIARIAMRTSAILLLIIWLYLLLSKILPMSMEMFLRSGNGQPKLIIESVAAIMILSSSIFIVFVLCRFALLKSRIFFS